MLIQPVMKKIEFNGMITVVLAQTAPGEGIPRLHVGFLQSKNDYYESFGKIRNQFCSERNGDFKTNFYFEKKQRPITFHFRFIHYKTPLVRIKNYVAQQKMLFDA